MGRSKFVYLLLFLPLSLWAVGQTTYQAKIIKPDGTALESTNVNFKFTILNAGASCTLYSETYSAVNMLNTGGLISFSLGTGVKTYPTSGTLTFEKVFDNAVATLTCEDGTSYSPAVRDNRKIVMQFNDGTGWQTLPAMAINAVPYAMFANSSSESLKLNGKADTEFVEYSTLANLNCQSNEAIKFNGVSFSCIAVGAGGGGSGGITSVTTSGSVLVTGGTASAPVISIQAASMSQDGYLTSVDYAEFKSKLSVSSAQIISTLGYVPASASSLGSLAFRNQIGSSDVTSALGYEPMASGTVTGSQWVTSGSTISYISGNVGIGTSDPTSLLHVYSNVTHDSPTFNGISSALDVDPTVSGGTRMWGMRTSINTLASSTQNLSSGNPSLTGIETLITHQGSGTINKVTAITAAVKNIASGTINEASAFRVFSPNGSVGSIGNLYGLKIENLTTTATNKWAIYQLGSTINSYFEGNIGIGKSTPVTKLSVSGGVQISMESATCAVSYAGTLRYNSGSVEFCNGSTWSAFGVAGTGITSSAASIAEVLGYVPASATGILSEERFADQSRVTSGSQYTKVTVDGKGRVTSGSQLELSDVTAALGYTPASNTVVSSQWNTSGTTINYLDGNVGIGTTTPTSNLEVSGTMKAVVNDTTDYDPNNLTISPTAADGLVIHNNSGTVNTTYAGLVLRNKISNVGAGRIALTGGSATSALTFLLRPNTGAVSASEIMRLSANGNVGVGTSSPVARLHVSENSNTAYSTIVQNSSSGSAAAALLQLLSNGGYNGSIMQTSSNYNGFADLPNSGAGMLVLNAGGTNNGIALRTGNAARPFIITGGNVGIASSTPSSRLVVKSFGTTSATSALHITDSSNASKLFVRDDGNIGVGTENPVAKLDVSGEIKFGNTASSCNVDNEGQQRYNSTSKKMEFCNGTVWSEIGGSSTTPAGSWCGGRNVYYGGGSFTNDTPSVACNGTAIVVSGTPSSPVITCPTGYTGYIFLLYADAVNYYLATCIKN